MHITVSYGLLTVQSIDNGMIGMQSFLRWISNRLKCMTCLPKNNT